MISLLAALLLWGGTEFQSVYETVSHDGEDLLLTLEAPPRGRRPRLLGVAAVCELPCNVVVYRERGKITGEDIPVERARVHVRVASVPQTEITAAVLAEAKLRPHLGRAYRSALPAGRRLIRRGETLAIRAIPAFPNMGKVVVSVRWKE